MNYAKNLPALILGLPFGHCLVHTTLPADKVGRCTGLGNGERLAKLFRQHIALSPTESRVTDRERIAKTGIGLTGSPTPDRRHDARSFGLTSGRSRQDSLPDLILDRITA